MAASDDSIVEYALETLAEIGEVKPRKMFGGVGIYGDGVMFALVKDAALYFKTAGSNVDDYEAAGSKPFEVDMRGKVTRMAYHEVPADVLDNGDRMREWALRSMAVALEAKKPAKSGG